MIASVAVNVSSVCTCLRAGALLEIGDPDKSSPCVRGLDGSVFIKSLRNLIKIIVSFPAPAGWGFTQ